MKRFIKTYTTKFIKNKKEFTRFYKNKLECSYCGFNLEPAALHFHHVIPTLKKHSVSYLFDKGDVKLLIDELSICTVLCSNCHMIFNYTEKDEIRKKIALSFSPIDIELFISCLENFEVSENLIAYEFSDDTEYQLKEEKEINIRNFSNSAVNSKRSIDDLTPEDIQEIIDLTAQGKSYRYITTRIFGEGRFGLYYNNIVRDVIESI